MVYVVFCVMCHPNTFVSTSQIPVLFNSISSSNLLFNLSLILACFCSVYHLQFPCQNIHPHNIAYHDVGVTRIVGFDNTHQQLFLIDPIVTNHKIIIATIHDTAHVGVPAINIMGLYDTIYYLAITSAPAIKLLLP